MLHIQTKKRLGLMVLSSLIFNPKLCGGPSIWRFLPSLVSTLPVVSDKKIKMWKSMDDNRLWRPRQNDDNGLHDMLRSGEHELNKSTVFIFIKQNF
jgi:hypothetical protein